MIDETMLEAKLERAGYELIDILALKPVDKDAFNKPMVITRWGRKTPLGLARTVLNILGFKESEV